MPRGQGQSVLFNRKIKKNKPLPLTEFIELSEEAHRTLLSYDYGDVTEYMNQSSAFCLADILCAELQWQVSEKEEGATIAFTGAPIVTNQIKNKGVCYSFWVEGKNAGERTEKIKIWIPEISARRLKKNQKIFRVFTLTKNEKFLTWPELLDLFKEKFVDKL